MRRNHVAAGLTAALAVLTLVLSPVALAAKAPGCDPLDARACLLPWPSNAFTVANERTDTGRQVKLSRSMLPRNAKGVPAFSAALNQADGFSPGTPIMTYVKGLDLQRTGAVPAGDLRSARDKRQPVVVIDTVTRQRQLVWAEIDPSASRGAEKLLVIHPARNFQTNRRYIVALRELKTASGATIPAGRAFRALRDGTKGSPQIERRRAAYKKIFRILGRAGIQRSNLYLAWDFTVASDRNLTERSLAIRDNVLANLGDDNLVDDKVSGRAPGFTVGQVQDLNPCGDDGCQAGESDQIARVVRGTLKVPCFLDKPGCPVGAGFRFKKKFEKSRFGNNRFTFVPLRSGANTVDAPVTCTIPRAAFNAPGRIVSVMSDLSSTPDADLLNPSFTALGQDANMVLCGTPLLGWSSADASGTGYLADLTKAPALVDRTQQGYLAQILLQRLFVHSQGLSSLPAFRAPSGRPVFDVRSPYALGVGTGAVIGGGAVTIAPDIARAAFVGGGMNLSYIMPRSTAFDAARARFEASYRDPLARVLLPAVYQTILDRGETNGYASQLGQSPAPSTPLKNVLLQTAAGDHQIPALTGEVEMRTVEGVVRGPAFDSGRYTEKIPMWEVNPAGSLELGSVLTVWDSGPVRNGGALGTPFAPPGPEVPRAGVDPHPLLMADPAVRKQQSDYLQVDGKLVDPCPKDRGCHLFTYPY